MTSGLTIRSASAALKAVAVAAALVCTGASMAADNATLKITSFTVSGATDSGNLVWTADAYQLLTMATLEGGGLFGGASKSFEAANWDQGLNVVATSANGTATGNTVTFTDAATQLATGGFNLAAGATAGAYPTPSLPNSAEAKALHTGAFQLYDANFALTGGTLTFDVYYDMSVVGPNSTTVGFGQTALSFDLSTDSIDTVSFSDGLLSSAFAGGSGSKSGHFTYTLQLGQGEYAYYSLAGTALAIAAPIPEPSTYALMALGLAGIAAVARRRRSTAAA